MESNNTCTYPESETIEKMLEEGNSKEALAILENAYDKDSRSTKVWNDLGALYFQNGKISEATDAFCQALELDPDNDDASENLIALGKSTVDPDANGSRLKVRHQKMFDHKQMLERGKLITNKIKDPSMFFNLNTVYFHTTSFCNYKCKHCPIAENVWNDPGNKRKYMHYEDFLRYFDKFVHGIKVIEDTFGFKYQREKILIQPQGGGEPLLHPEFSNIVNHITNNGFSIKLTTNGALLNGKRADALLNANLNELHVSIDASSPETYGKIRQKGQFERVVGNLEKFMSYYSGKKEHPLFVVSFCNAPQNSKDFKQFCEYWAPRVDVIWIQKYNDPHGSEKDSAIVPKKRIFCNRLPGYFMIEDNGDVKGCQCGDYIAGNLEYQSFEEIMLSKNRIHIFELQEKGSFNMIEECRDCTKWTDKISASNPVIISINNKAYYAQRSNASLHIRNVYGLNITTLDNKSLFP